MTVTFTPFKSYTTAQLTYIYHSWCVSHSSTIGSIAGQQRSQQNLQGGVPKYVVLQAKIVWEPLASIASTWKRTSALCFSDIEKV